MASQLARAAAGGHAPSLMHSAHLRPLVFLKQPQRPGRVAQKQLADGEREGGVGVVAGLLERREVRVGRSTRVQEARGRPSSTAAVPSRPAQQPSSSPRTRCTAAKMPHAVCTSAGRRSAKPATRCARAARLSRPGKYQGQRAALPLAARPPQSNSAHSSALVRLRGGRVDVGGGRRGERGGRQGAHGMGAGQRGGSASCNSKVKRQEEGRHGSLGHDALHVLWSENGATVGPHRRSGGRHPGPESLVLAGPQVELRLVQRQLWLAAWRAGEEERVPGGGGGEPAGPARTLSGSSRTQGSSSKTASTGSPSFVLRTCR